MQQLNFVGIDKLEWREAPQPRLLGDREALVRPLSVATCDLDARIVRGAAPLQGPFPFGHEGVAEVIDIGDAVKALNPGDLVSVPFQISCGQCESCLRGKTAHCSAVPKMSMYGLGSMGGIGWGGFLSDLVRVPFADHMLVPVPAGIEPNAIASLSDNIVDAWRTVGPQLEAEPGSAVLIAGGANSISLYATAIAVALGASRVDFVGGSPHELEVAAQLGANVIEGPFPARLGSYPITVDSSWHHAGLKCALCSTAPDGICTSIGIYFEPETPMPLLSMYSNGIRFVTGRVHARTTMPKVLDLVSSGRLRPELVTSRIVPWEDAADALAGHQTKLVISRPTTFRTT